MTQKLPTFQFYQVKNKIHVIEKEECKIIIIIIIIIIDEFKIEGFQNFNQYLKINPVAVQIIESQIQNKLLFYSKNYEYRFIANSLLFSLSIQIDTNIIFITTNGLNDAKEILINRKLFQGIAVIYLSEIDSWENIKKHRIGQMQCLLIQNIR